MTNTNDRDNRIAQVLDEVFTELRSSGQVNLSSYTARYPDLAAELPGLIDTVRTLDSVFDDCRDAGSNTAAHEPLSQSTDAEIPALVGRYRILSPLGAGGMGTVYRARDPQLNRIVAVKVPRFD